VLLKLFWVVFK